MKYKKLKQIFEEDEIQGGLADAETLADIAAKHGKPLSHIQKQFKMGVAVEREHTDEKSKASEIARDHLWEDPDYYTRLKEMESTKESEAEEK